ncbi:MAG: 1,4-alpha-glucan branching enzyme [Candidatus Sumerlaeota bacterium]|nr:1,4-alpha-glucan branching enzyme [Candidatus Sumerlaeota bacterium]
MSMTSGSRVRRPAFLLSLLAALPFLAAASSVTVDPNPPQPGEAVTITYDATDGPLAAASQVYLHLGWNGWTSVVSPGPAMTAGGAQVWTYTATVPGDALQLDCVFNNGAGTWDNNGNADWHFAVEADLDLSGYPLGANPSGSELPAGTVFRVWAPNATSAAVAGTFNGWSASANAMEFDAASGIWSAFVPGAGNGDEYKFVFQSPGVGELWRIDPYARDTTESTGNGIVASDGSDYPWQATDWQTPDHEDLLIYQVHVGTFSGEGDGVPRYPATYRDVVDAHLDDLKALGVNMVHLLPVHEFPFVSWGYNPVHFFAPESSYGTPDDLRYMIDTLHANGIGVLLDVVYNHTSTSDNNLWDFDGPENIYFFGDTCQGETPWGSTRPRYTEQQVRDLITENAAYWIREFRFDGLRVDSTANMRGYCNEAGEGWLLMGDIVEAVKAENPGAIVIAEELPNNAIVTTPRSQGGAGYDAQWDDQFTDTFRAQLAGSDINISALATAISGNNFGRSNTEAVKYVESHDEAGNDVRLTELIDSADPSSTRALDLAKVAGGLTLLSPGIPMLLQGQELAESRQFGDTSDSRPRWSLLPARAPIRDFFATMGQLRTSRGSLRAGEGIQITHANDSADVVAFQRYNTSGDVTFVVANFGDTDFTSYLVGVPTSGVWYELANSQAASYGGNGTENGSVSATAQTRDGLPATLDIALPARALLVFSKTPLQTEPDPLVDTWVLF